MVLSRDKVEVVGALRLPLGGDNGYVGVRSRQGYNKDKFQGTTPTKKRRTKLFDSCFEAAVALAELIQQPQEQDDPIKHLDFASPISGAPPARCVWAAGRRAIVPQCPAAKASACELPCVHVGMPMTTAQLSLAHICGMPFVRAVPSVPDVSYSPHSVGVAIAT